LSRESSHRNPNIKIKMKTVEHLKPSTKIKIDMNSIPSSTTRDNITSTAVVNAFSIIVDRKAVKAKKKRYGIACQTKQKKTNHHQQQQQCTKTCMSIKRAFQTVLPLDDTFDDVDEVDDARLCCELRIGCCARNFVHFFFSPTNGCDCSR
jgi:hypothetical protein